MYNWDLKLRVDSSDILIFGLCLYIFQVHASMFFVCSGWSRMWARNIWILWNSINVWLRFFESLSIFTMEQTDVCSLVPWSFLSWSTLAQMDFFPFSIHRWKLVHLYFCYMTQLFLLHNLHTACNLAVCYMYLNLTLITISHHPYSDVLTLFAHFDYCS